MPTALYNFKNQTGSIVLIIALSLSLILTMFSIFIDTGYLYTTKNIYQNAVEAAAMAGAASLCDEDPVGVAKEIAVENGLSEEFLVVRVGFYDQNDEYNDFPEYKDFVWEESGIYPEGEYNNAVMVILRTTEKTLMGGFAGKDEVTVGAAAVAYLQRIDMVSLDPQGAIDIGHESVWEDVVFFSNGDISYPQAVTLTTSGGTKTYSPPEFNNCLLYAAGQVLSCTVETKSWNWGMYTRVTEILWDSGSSQSGSHIFSGVDPITSIRPVDDEYLEEWRDRADIIYTPDQAGEDDVFYRAQSGYYSFDLTGLSGVIFFDGEENAGQIEVHIDPRTPQDPGDDSITNLTFVTNCNIEMLNTSNIGGSSSQVVKLYVGGEDEDRAMFISTGDIEVQPLIGDDIQFKGAVFRTGGDFITYNGGAHSSGGGSSSHKIRVIADGSIIGRSYQTNYSKGNINIGLYGITNNSRFAPPCPPVMARLGRLEASEE